MDGHFFNTDREKRNALDAARRVFTRATVKKLSDQMYVLRLTNNLNAHPLYIKTALGSGTANYITDTSVVENQGSINGTVVFTPTSIGTYYYQCSAHTEMNGIIQVEY